ncbi:MAG TPA: hypothetical protein VGN49_05530 [Micrococcaceae bacterium]|nr:hypothetical protein [Micrococcaceae bacterium]
MTVFSLRQATVGDVAEMVRQHMAAHEETYGGLVPQEFFTQRRTFYTRNGFAPDGKRELLSDRCGNLPEIRMVRR